MHVASERINAYGEKAVMRCILCGAEGSIGEMMTGQCSAEAQPSGPDALLAVLGLTDEDEDAPDD